MDVEPTDDNTLMSVVCRWTLRPIARLSQSMKCPLLTGYTVWIGWPIMMALNAYKWLVISVATLRLVFAKCALSLLIEKHVYTTVIYHVVRMRRLVRSRKQAISKVVSRRKSACRSSNAFFISWRISTDIITVDIFFCSWTFFPWTFFYRLLLKYHVIESYFSGRITTLLKCAVNKGRSACLSVCLTVCSHSWATTTWFRVSKYISRSNLETVQLDRIKLK